VLVMGERPGADPFAIVQDEINAMSDRMRRSIVSEVPVLKQAAEYFFRKGSEGKRFRPTMILLMSSALSPMPVHARLLEADLSPHNEKPTEVRRAQQRISEVTEMIHVASLLHDDVIDTAETRRGMMSLNSLMGNRLAVLAGDFLLARASVTLASLHNSQAVELMSCSLEHLVSGEVMQMTETQDDLASHEHYQKKTFYKTASLLANSAKSVAVLDGQSEEVCELAYAYGRHVGLAFQFVDDVLDFVGTLSTLGKPALSDLKSGLATAPVLYAAEEFPAMDALIKRKFTASGDVEQALLWVQQSRGIERTRELALYHIEMARECVAAFPHTDAAHSIEARQGLIDLTHRVLSRTK